MPQTNEHRPARAGRAGFKRLAPEADAALAALGKAVAGSGLEKDLVELVEVRASQINGCAFCVRYHLDLARRHGVAAEKLDLLVVWREAPVFSARERAALAFAELLTEPGRGGVPDADHAAALAQFSERELAHLTAAIATINAWNRIALAFGFELPGAAPV